MNSSSDEDNDSDSPIFDSFHPKGGFDSILSMDDVREFRSVWEQLYIQILDNIMADAPQVRKYWSYNV